MHDLRSHRLDHPGRPSEDELPKKPFGLFDLPEVNEPVKKPTEWTIEREAGLRTSKFYFIFLSAMSVRRTSKDLNFFLPPSFFLPCELRQNYPKLLTKTSIPC